MIKLGFTSAQMRDYLSLLVNNHRVSIRVQILDLDHNYISDESDRFVEGQINIDTTADISRSLDLTLFDPNHNMHLDPNSPNDGAVWNDRMVRILYVISDPKMTKSYTIPCFTGPIDNISRDDYLVSISCVGKEKLVSDTAWVTKSFPKGTRRMSLLTYLLQTLGGEAKCDFTPGTNKLPRSVSISNDTVPWVLAKEQARAMNRMLFYDGRGTAVLRYPTARSMGTMHKAVLSIPQVNYDSSTFYNCVEVIGAKPKGAKQNITYRIVAPKNHPLSPYQLGRRGAPRFVPLVIEDDSIRTKSEAKRVAKQKLKDGLIEAISVTFDCMAMPHLEEGDVVRLQTNDYALSFRIQQMTIPLTADTNGSMGYLRRMSPKPRPRRVSGRN